MSDSYDAIYNAVRSKISGGDIGSTVREVAESSFDISWARDAVKQEFINAAWEMQRPAVLYRPRVFIDGAEWCALYGENIQDGVAGFGVSPAAAMADFDRNWDAVIGGAA